MDSFSFLDDITDANLALILADFKNAGILMPFLMLLSTEDKKRIRKMGTKFEGYVSEIVQAAITFPDAIPPANPFSEFKSRLDVYNKLTNILNASSSLHQLIEDTHMKLGGELLACANVYYNSFQRSSKNNTAMNETMAKLSAVYKKTTHAMPVIMSIAASGSLQVLNVVTGTELVNKGKGVITFKPGNDVAGKIRQAAITVDPMSSATIPKGWTSIEVTNLSTTLETSVSVRVK